MKVGESFSGANHFIGALVKAPSDTLSKTWRGIQADFHRIGSESDPDIGNAAAGALGTLGAGASLLVAIKTAPLTLGASLVVAAASADHYLKKGEELSKNDAPAPSL